MSKGSFRTALAVVLGSLLIVAVVAVWLITRALAYPGAAHAGAGKDVDIEIRSGMSFPAIASMLATKGVIDKPSWFRIYAMWEGETTNVKTGKYVLKDNLAPSQVLATLIAGIKEVAIKVTLPEGKHMLEFFELLEAAKVAKAVDLEALARDKELLGRHGITGDTVEGYLFPDTYQFRVNEKPAAVLQRLITRHQEVWNEVLAKHPKDAAKLKDKLGWSDREILTMASIVEKEAVDPAERPRIAQVFINRLSSPTFTPKRLETDPTIRYGCMVPVQKSPACQQWNKADRLRRAQLDDKVNPYNTYQHEGLPPGPIANPGKGSLEAVLAPDGSEFYFFVAKDARTHAFARTFEDHKRNVDRYMK
ncbi:MAG: endolytic transglycosylase MltG [Myxococcales bacterium]|nr:endolytic transglycosylase MltG [Myxococcales bacterium]